MTTKRLKPATYALTILTHQRQNLFQRTENAYLMIDTLFRYRDQGRFSLHAFVVMPDHLHTLITPAIDQSTARCVQLIKGGFSFSIREQFQGDVWHSGHHEHRVRDPNDFFAQKRYIAANPSRKNLTGHPFVHSTHESRIDPIPSHLAGHSEPLL